MENRNLDSATFGSTPAAKCLVDKLNSGNYDSRIIKKVSRNLSNFGLMLNELEKVDTRIRLGIAKTMSLTYKSGFKNLPSELKSYCENVLCTKYRIWFRKQNGNIPYKVRKKDK